MNTMQRFLIGLLIILLSVMAMFWVQNAERFPMVDVHGHFLSFDLLFVGGVVAQPISVATLMLVSFAVGGLFAFLFQALFKLSSNKNEYSEF